MSTTFSDNEVNNCFSIYHTSWITSAPKGNFICDNIPTKAILFFFGCSELNSTWLITSELANQRARKALFTCVVYTNHGYLMNGNDFWFRGTKPQISCHNYHWQANSPKQQCKITLKLNVGGFIAFPSN